MIYEGFPSFHGLRPEDGDVPMFWLLLLATGFSEQLCRSLPGDGTNLFWGDTGLSMRGSIFLDGKWA